MIMNYEQNQYSRTKDVNTNDFFSLYAFGKLERVPKRLHLKFDETTSDFLPTFYAYMIYFFRIDKYTCIKHYNLGISLIN